MILFIDIWFLIISTTVHILYSTLCMPRKILEYDTTTAYYTVFSTYTDIEYIIYVLPIYNIIMYAFIIYYILLNDG